MSAFGVKILTRVLIPYTFGIFFTCFGGKRLRKRLLKKEKVEESVLYTVESVLYILVGLFLSLGAIIHLLFVE